MTITIHSRTQKSRERKGKMDFDLEKPLSSFKEHQHCTISELFASETDHMPSPNCLNSTHCEAISLILQVQHSCNLDPFVAYLAINYLHRFMSKQEFRQGKPWLIRLISISCLSLASKMKNTHLPFSKLQREGCNFNGETTQKMELVILGALNWRMRSITPFPFLNFFISLAQIKDQSLKDRAAEIIFNVHNDIKFLEYKPSTVAAASLIYASYELFPQQYSILRATVTTSEHIDKDTLAKCIDMMHYMWRNEVKGSMKDTSFLSTETPVSVLDRSTKRQRI